MRKILTLQDVGIPDISEEEFRALAPLDKVSVTFQIRDDEENLDTGYPRIVFRY